LFFGVDLVMLVLAAGLSAQGAGVSRALLDSAGPSRTAADTSALVTFGGFVDTYYAWDFGRPPTVDRSFAGGALFTTQPARHNEFNVNLAFLEAKVTANRVRGRLALQAGTSVQSNYAGEPTKGQIQGPALAQHVQEAVAGVRVASGVWVDAGIFFSHMGMESWISRDNPTYTRSLVAEYSPYYQSGVKFTWTPSSRVTAQLDVVNGWQNISENNSGKGTGVRVDFAPAPGAAVSYYNFFSDEAGNRLRTFNGVGTKWTGGPVTLLAEFDIGSQARSANDGGTATWYGAVGVIRLLLNSNVAAIGRAERYDDKDKVIVATGSDARGNSNGPLRANGGSVGLDVALQSRVLWRNELRVFSNHRAIFPNGTATAATRTNALAVTSLAITM
jgi:hypothetical protein